MNDRRPRHNHRDETPEELDEQRRLILTIAAIGLFIAGALWMLDQNVFDIGFRDLVGGIWS